MARPRIPFTEPQLADIELRAGLGLTDERIAAALGVSSDTLARRKRDTPAVRDAYARGMAKAESLVAQALFKRATSGDVAAIKWWEQTRAGKAERQEHTGPSGAPIAVSVTRRIIRPGPAEP